MRSLAALALLCIGIPACSDDAGTGAAAANGGEGQGASESTSTVEMGGAPSTGGAGEGGSPGETEAVHLVGRFDHGDPAGARFAWSGTSISATFSGTSISIELAGDADVWFDVLVDGATTTTFATTGGEASYELASGLADGEHSIEVFRRVEAWLGVVTFERFSPEASLVPSAPKHARKIEVIGASIASGYGTEDPANGCETFQAEDAFKTFGAVTARALDADAHIISWSGKGVFANADDGPDTIPVIYGRTLPEDPSSAWDFSQYVPDIVLINAGKNDISAGVAQDDFEGAYLGLLQTVRQRYPNAWVYCMAGAFMADPATESIQNAVDAAADPKMQVALFDIDWENGVGCDGHPDAETHATWADQLIPLIQEDLGW